MALNSADIQFFAPGDDLHVVARDLPHWMQAGTVSFITWRTWDSIPTSWLGHWRADRWNWFVNHGIDPRDRDWRDAFDRLPMAARQDFHRALSARWESCLDSGSGECVLRRPGLRSIVADSLHHFDGVRYILLDLVVMPNHVHALVAFPQPTQMLAQCASWKHFTGTKINRLLGRRGRFWQVDDFDHLVRSAEQFDKFRRYIALNPVRAGLRADEHTHFSAPNPFGAAALKGHSRSE